MQNFYNDLEQLQEAYDKTFSNQGMFKLTYQGYLKRCKERNVPKSAIMSEEEWDAIQSGDMDPMTEYKDSENGYKLDDHINVKKHQN